MRGTCPQPSTWIIRVILMIALEGFVIIPHFTGAHRAWASSLRWHVMGRCACSQALGISTLRRLHYPVFHWVNTFLLRHKVISFMFPPRIGIMASSKSAQTAVSTCVRPPSKWSDMRRCELARFREITPALRQSSSDFSEHAIVTVVASSANFSASSSIHNSWCNKECALRSAANDITSFKVRSKLVVAHVTQFKRQSV